MRKLGLLSEPSLCSAGKKGLWDHELHVVDDVGGEGITRRSSPSAQRNLLIFVLSLLIKVFTLQTALRTPAGLLHIRGIYSWKPERNG